MVDGPWQEIEGVLVSFSKLENNDRDMRVYEDSNNVVLGVSYEDSMKWKKKAIHTRVGIGILTIVCTALMVVLLLTIELQLHCEKSKKAETNFKNQSLKDAVKFLLFSDFHFDYFYDETIAPKPTNCRRFGNHSNASYKAVYGRIDCDSPGALVDNMLGAIVAAGSDRASFVLMTGDFSAHRMDRWYFPNGSSTSKRVLNNICISANKTKMAFPSLPIFPMLGNNDLPGHYILPVTSQWYIDTLALFAPLILCTGCPDSVPKPTNMEALKKTFLDGGYYSVNLTNTNDRMMLLVLNSLYWSVQASTGNPVIQETARRQMTWFEQQLNQAQQMNQKVFIASHIPPGIDPFDGANFWLSNYTQMYVKLVAGDYRDIVAGQFYAHIHKDDFHLQVLEPQNPADNPTNKSFALLVPSVSPIYSNNPAFRVGYIDAEKQALLDYDQYYMDIVMATEFNAPKWQFSYRFSESYPSTNPHINADRVYELNQGLLNTTSDKTWLSYVFSRAVNYQPGPYSRFGLYCAMRYVFDKDHKECIKKYKVSGG